MDEFICNVANKITCTHNLFVPPCIPSGNISCEVTTSNIEANKHYADRINNAIELYEEKLRDRMASYHSTEARLQDMVAHPGKRVHKSTSNNLREDWENFSRLGLDNWQPVVDSKNHMLGMGQNNGSKQQFSIYNTLGDLLNNRPREVISPQGGSVPCRKYRKGPSRDLRDIYFATTLSSFEEKDNSITSLGCRLL